MKNNTSGKNAEKQNSEEVNNQFSKEEIEAIRSNLLEMRKNILKGIDESIRQGSSKDTTEYQGDNYDIAASERDRELTYMLGDRERKKINEIDDALSKIKTGDYGICDECGEQIAKKRLQLIPYSNLCIHCQSHIEEEEKLQNKDSYLDGLEHIALLDEDDGFKDLGE